MEDVFKDDPYEKALMLGQDNKEAEFKNLLVDCQAKGNFNIAKLEDKFFEGRNKAKEIPSDTLRVAKLYLVINNNKDVIHVCSNKKIAYKMARAYLVKNNYVKDKKSYFTASQEIKKNKTTTLGDFGNKESVGVVIRLARLNQ